MKYKYISYIVNEFSKVYTSTLTDSFENKLLQKSADELYRLANAIDRFGVENLVDCIK